MMQSTDLRNRNHSAAGRRLDFTFDRRVAVEEQMSPRQVIVPEVRSQDVPQVSFVYHDDMIETLSTD